MASQQAHTPIAVAAKKLVGTETEILGHNTHTNKELNVKKKETFG